MVSGSKGLLDQSQVESNRNYEGSGRAKSGRVSGKDPSLKSAWRGASAIRGVVPKWVTAAPKGGRGAGFVPRSASGPDRRRHVTAQLKFVKHGPEYAGKVAGNANYLGKRKAVDRGETDKDYERYLEREGPFFTAKSDGIKAGQVAEACKNDPLQYRLMINPDDGNNVTVKEMKAFVREFMSRVERETSARIAWAAVIHKADTLAHAANRHAHIVIRSRDMDGRTFRFAPAFVKQGFRSIARDMMTERFGPLNDREMEHYRERFERNQPRNREWKRMEREGASMAEKRAFAKEGREKARQAERSPSRARQHERTPAMSMERGR